MEHKTALKKVFLAEVISIEDQSRIFGTVSNFPIVYLKRLHSYYLQGKEITILFLPDTELEYYSTEKILEFLELTFKFTDITLLAAEPTMYLRIKTLLQKRNTQRLFLNKITSKKDIDSLKINNFFSFLTVVAPFRQKQRLLSAAGDVETLTEKYDYVNLEKNNLN